MIGRNSVLAVAAGAALLLIGCRQPCGVSHVRFWEATVPETGHKYYTVDTESHPLGVSEPARFLSPDQRIFRLTDYELKQISGANYVLATNGGKWKVHGGEYNRPPCRAVPVPLGGE